MKTYFIPLLVTQVHTVVAPDINEAIEIAMNDADCHEGTMPLLCNADLKSLNSNLTDEDEAIIDDIIEQCDEEDELITMFEEEF